jgi:hypothetical protein
MPLKLINTRNVHENILTKLMFVTLWFGHVEEHELILIREGYISNFEKVLSHIMYSSENHDQVDDKR